MSKEKLPDNVVKLAGDIKWHVKADRDGDFPAGASWQHVIYVTLAQPIDMAGTREEGITTKHMETAVRLVGSIGSNEPHPIVAGLMGLLGTYWLEPTPPPWYTGPPPEPRFGYPKYFNGEGGAWPIADTMGAVGECQAIVRFVRAMIKQVGCPGTANVVLVFADPDVNNGNDALEEDFEAPVPPGKAYANYGLIDYPSKVINGQACEPTLVDRRPTEGQVYNMKADPRSTTPPTFIGANNFEACLKFTAGTPGPPDVVKYYGGGAGTYPTKERVILAFQALCWVSELPSPPGKRLLKVVKIIKRYHP
jgi:hypothetical protein